MAARLACLDEPPAPGTIRALRERIDLLTEENRQLREAREELRSFPPAWRLTKTEMRFLSALMKARSGMMSSERLLTAIYGLEPEVGIEILKVFVCKIRKKLAAAGVHVEIRTIWGEGFGLPAEGRAALHAAMVEADGVDEARREAERESLIARLTAQVSELTAALAAIRTEAEQPRSRPEPPVIETPRRAKRWERWRAPPEPAKPPAFVRIRGRRHGR